MKILERYVLRQFLPPFFLAIFVLTFVLLMDRLFLLADLLVRKGVPIVIVGEIAALSLPFVAMICTPLGSLIGGVTSFGRLAQDNESRVVSAAGICPVRLVLPVAVLCLFLFGLMFLFNSFVVPEAQHRVRNLLTDVARKRPALRVREGVFMDDFSGYMIYIGTIDERRSRVADVAIFSASRDASRPGFLTAPRGELTYTPDDRYMILTLLDGEMHETAPDSSYRRLRFSRHTINVRMDEELVRREREYRGDEEMPLPQLLASLNQLRHEVALQSARVRAARAAVAGNEAESLRVEEEAARLRYRRMELSRFAVEFHKRVSVAFSTFFFLLFGAPLGLLLRRGGIGTGFMVGLVFFAVYYLLLLAGQNLAESGRVWPWLGMWLPNIVLAIPTVELASRALLERPMIGRRAWK